MFMVNKDIGFIKILQPYFIMLLFCILLFCSCVKDDDKLTFESQETDIDKYVKALEHRSEVYPEGVWRVIYEEGDGNTLVEQGSQIRVGLELYQFGRGPEELFYTNKGNSGDGDEWVTVGNNSILRGLDIGLVGASLYEKCYIIFSSRHGFGNIQVGIVPKMKPLLIDVTIKEIKNN